MPDFLPVTATLEGLLEYVATDPRAAVHFYEQFKKLLTAQGLHNKFNDLLVAIQKFTDNVQKEQNGYHADVYGGQPMIPLETLRAQIAAAQQALVTEEQALIEEQPLVAEQSVPSAEQEAYCVVEINAQSQWERFYTDNLEQSVHADIDALLQQWITDHGMLRHNHIMYTAAEPPQVVSRQELLARFADPEQGFAQYVRERSAGKYQLNLELREIEAPVPASQTTPSSGGTTN